MADRFYINWPLAPGTIVLEGPEAHHLVTVRRFRPGDVVCLFNGDGREYPAEVEEAGRRHVVLRVLGRESPAREVGFRFEVAAPLPKGDRADFLIEKLTELGVSAFIPLRTQYSVVHPRDAKIDRLERHVVEASKQCGRNTLMQIGPLTAWEVLLERQDLPAVKWLAHPGGLAGSRRSGEDVLLAVGPEGGFAAEEVEAARQRGWQVLGLGPRILRVETAALVLAAWCLAPPSA